ncbi:hypothetical protein BU17DRAFT_47991, partial [Hysterangium stoloniferum]
SSIVTIHGLDGHREASFTAPNSILWLRDLLPDTLPNARILTYGYDARTRGVNRSNQALYDLSIDFIAKLSSFRVYTNTDARPLIFIAHSFGGIMLKKALIHANATHIKHLPAHKAVEVSTYGIIYLGTPHQGIDLTDWTRSLMRYFSITSQADGPIMKHLGLHSETLQQLMAEYTAISGRFQTVFCYETYDTLGPGATGHVPVISAVVQGSVNTEVIAIHKDHLGLAHFSSVFDNEYSILTQHLLLMARQAPSVILRYWEKHSLVLCKGYQWSNNPGMMLHISASLMY